MDQCVRDYVIQSQLNAMMGSLKISSLMIPCKYFDFCRCADEKDRETERETYLCLWPKHQI